MAMRSDAARRMALAGLAMAGALAVAAGPAAAQYYIYEEEILPRDDGYRYRPLPRYLATLPPTLPMRDIGLIARREFGLARIERTLRSGQTYVIDGETARGRRVRLLLDAYSGDLIDRIPLPGSRPATPADEIARVEPRADGGRRLVPLPPQRPPAPKPPAEASAPASVVPRPPAAPPAPSPGPTTPETGAMKPRLVNPQDVRGSEDAERLPPLARASGGAASPASRPIELPPIELPPLRMDDIPAAKPAEAP